MTTPRLNATALDEAARRAGDSNRREIARRTGICESTVSRLARGQTVPTLPTLLAFRRAYKVTLDQLVDTGEAAA